MSTGTTPPPFRERLSWDQAAGEIRDGGIRYIMLRPDGLMGMFRHLAPEHRGPALAALAASIQEHGGGSARSYRDMGAATPDALLAVIARTAPQLGWGQWRFGPSGDGRLDLEVANSPFAAGYGPAQDPVCAPIAGMLAALAGMVLDGPVAVRETDCAAAGAPACRFTARAVTEAGPQA